MSSPKSFYVLGLAAIFLAAPVFAQSVAPALKRGAPVAKPVAAAAAPVGYVKKVTGIAFVVTAGQPVRAEVGTPVMEGAVLRTGTASTLGVTFLDSTMMSFGPETELTVNEFLFAPASSKLRLDASLTRGTLNYVSGVIAKLKPDAVNVQTPVAMIGVRGTQFAIKIEAGEK